MWPIALIMEWSPLRHVCGPHKTPARKVEREGKYSENFYCAPVLFATHTWRRRKDEVHQPNIFISCCFKVNVRGFFGVFFFCSVDSVLYVSPWDFLLILSVSPHRVLPLGRGISWEKRKPLPHYAANFRHQEKMFGKSWPRFQLLELHRLTIPTGEAGWFWFLSELKETIYNIYSRTSNVSYRSPASSMNDSIWNSNFVFTVIRGNISPLGK